MSKLNQQAQTVNIEFPEVRPALDMRFALAKKLDPRITFTRGTTGTYTGPDGYIKTAAENEPRFEHDPITGKCKGLLMEQFRTNLLKYSNQFENWTYSDSITLVPNSAISPDGTLNAYKQIEGTAKYLHRNTQQIILSSTPKTYTLSVFIKPIDTSNLRNFEFGFFGGDGFVDSYVDYSVFLKTGFINIPGVTGSYSVVAYGAIPYPNGWYRFYVSATTSSFSNISPFYGTWTASEGNSYQGDGTSSFYVYGAQFEEGTYPTSYMSTTSSTFTRGGDLAVIQGTNFSSWFGDSSPQELSVFFSGYSPDVVIGRNPNYGIIYWRLSNLSRSEFISHEYAGLPQFVLNKNGATINGIFTFSNDLLNIKSMCLLNSKKIRIILNESKPSYEFSVSPIAAVPTGIIRLAIGGAEDYDGAQINGTVERLTVYSKELSLNQAQSFTL